MYFVADSTYLLRLGELQEHLAASCGVSFPCHLSLHPPSIDIVMDQNPGSTGNLQVIVG